MTEEKNSKALKVLTAVLTLGIIALGIYTVSFYMENQEKITRLETEKAGLEDDLNELIVKYDDAIATNDVMAKDLYEAKQRIETLLDSIQGMDKANYTVIRRFRNQINQLEREKERLFKTVDSLSKQNTRLANAVETSQTQLQQRIIYSDSVAQQNAILNEKISEGAKLQLTRLTGEGVIIKSSGDIVNTQRHRRTDKVRTCFNIGKNLITEPGDKALYIQVINPKNNLLGPSNTITFGEKVLQYSEKTTVFYENEDVDVCLLIDTEEKNIMSGIYTVNVFLDAELLASSSFDLK